MQISPLAPGSLSPASTSTGSVQRTSAPDSVTRTQGIDSAARPTDVSPPLRTGLQAHDAQLNRRIANGQQTQAYLTQVAAQLEGLKTEISTQLSSPTLNPAIDSRLQRFTALWQQRPQATGHSLSAQLDYRADGQAQQHFKMRGLDLRNLQMSERETLSFVTGSGTPTDQRILTAVLTPEQSPAARLRLIDQTLAVAQIRVRHNAQGEITLSTPDANWPHVRDGFSVKGGGIRFPANQFHRIKLEAEPDAIRPETWKTQDAQALRDTLQQLIPALAKVRQANEAVQLDLDAVADRLAPQGATDQAEWAHTFVSEFVAMGQQPGYAVFAALAPAVQGVSRHRVENLLAIKS